MKLISPYVHGWLDYITMISLLIVPLTIKLNGRAEFMLIGFALFEFILAVITRYPLGATRQLPFPVHGVIDLISGIAFLAGPWLFGFSARPEARGVYLALGVYYVLIWVLTDFRGDIAPAGVEVPA